MIRSAIIGPLTEIEYETPEHRHAACMESLRERFLEEVSTKDIQTIADEAEMAGWNSREVRRAIDALAADRARAAGVDPC
jgi:hypothetical protein